MTFKDAKYRVRAFLRNNYSDTHMTQALDHARAGNFSFTSCCCLVGIPTATHALVGQTVNWQMNHYYEGRMLLGGVYAESGAAMLGRTPRSAAIDDALLRRRLIPMFLAEIRRREKARHGRMETAAIVESTPSPVL